MICSNCHERSNKKTLDVRTWQCEHRGVRHDRDVNAAINILLKAVKENDVSTLEIT